MARIYELIGTIFFTYSFIYVFQKLSRYKNSNVNLKIKCILVISIIDFILYSLAIKPIRLGVYYILLEICIYLIYEKKQFNFFISYILTFWIFQISDICLGLLLSKNTLLLNILNNGIYAIGTQLIVVFIAVILANCVSKINNINKTSNLKENNLLWTYTNIMIIVYMVLIHYYNISSNTENIIILSIIVLCFFLFMSYIIFSVLNKLYIEKNEKHYIERYNQIIEESLNNMRTFKHDHKNIVLAIGGFLDTNDIEGLKKYFYENIDNNQYIDDKILYGLNNIKNSPVKGLIYAKILRAISKGINLNIHIEDSIDNFIIKDVDICRILGIVIDNAIEASIESNQKILTIVILSDESEISIIVSNSFKDKPITYKIFEKGYSTKGENRGLGLSIVRELNEKKYPNMDISTKIEKNLFYMEIILKK